MKNKTEDIVRDLPTEENFDAEETKILGEERESLEDIFEEEAREEEETAGRTVSPTGMVMKRFVPPVPPAGRRRNSPPWQ